jgi:hypothetical protein
MAEMGLTTLPSWRGAILSGLGSGYDPLNVFACFTHGFLYFLPIFLVALLVSASWDAVFSLARNRPLDDGLLAWAWLFALILPAGAPQDNVTLGTDAPPAKRIKVHIHVARLLLLNEVCLAIWQFWHYFIRVNRF